GDVADEQRTVRDQPAIGRLLHIGLVGVVGRKVAGDTGEQIDVGFRHRLREGGAIADVNVEVAHLTGSLVWWFRNSLILAASPPSEFLNQTTLEPEVC